MADSVRQNRFALASKIGQIDQGVCAADGADLLRDPLGQIAHRHIRPGPLAQLSVVAEPSAGEDVGDINDRAVDPLTTAQQSDLAGAVNAAGVGAA